MYTPDLSWTAPPTNSTLLPDQVHVFCAVLNQPPGRLQQLSQTLSADEQQRASRFRFETDRQHFIVCRGILRTILGRYLDLEPSQLQFSYGSHRKPALAPSTASSNAISGKLQFNVSHSHELALYALTLGREIGVDLEHIRPMPDAEQIAQRFFAPGEYAAFRTIPQPQKQLAFFQCWTRKEAYIKALGQGLSFPLSQFEVSLVPGEPARLLHTSGDSREAASWMLQELNPAPNYVAALAIKAKALQIQCFRWTD
jgi:4'-phosphopantetheinyl transferase